MTISFGQKRAIPLAKEIIVMLPDCYRQKPGNRNCLGFSGKCSLIAASARFSYSVASANMSASSLSCAKRCIVGAITSAATEEVSGLLSFHAFQAAGIIAASCR
jgi:hypothetical protein